MTLKKARILFFIFIFLVTCFLAFNPGHNGDMSFYIATALNFQGKSEQQAISDAKGVIRSELKDREAVYHISNLDHAATGILDFYRIKPFYIAIINVLHRLGFSYIMATLIPSLVSYFLIGSLVFSWASKILRPLPALITSAILMLMNPSVVIGRLSTPDALSNLLIFICLYGIYFGRNYKWIVVVLFSSLFVRLDNFLSLIIILNLMFFWPVKDEKSRMPWLSFISLLFLAGLLCVWENYYFTSNFWWFRQVTYAHSVPAYSYQILIYFYSISISYVPVLTLLTCLAFLNGSTNPPKKTYFMMAAFAAIIFVRFLCFPSFEERFFTAYYLSSFLIVLELLSWNKLSITTPEKSHV